MRAKPRMRGSFKNHVCGFDTHGRRGQVSGASGISLLHDVKKTTAWTAAEELLFDVWTACRMSGIPRSTPGGARRDRTDDLLLAKQALSQLSYGPFTLRKPEGQGSAEAAEIDAAISPGPPYRSRYHADI